MIQGCSNQCKNHAPPIESHGLTEVGSATDLPNGMACTNFFKCSCILKNYISYPIRVTSKKKQGEPADPKAKRSAQPRKNKQSHFSKDHQSLSALPLPCLNLQLVSNNIATWLLTTVPGSMEQHQPPPWFVPTIQFHALRLWQATILPCRP